MADTISAYMQVYKTPRAVFEALKSFRTHYASEAITVLCDNGDDFSEICAAFDATYIHSDRRVVIGPSDQRTSAQSTLDGIYISLSRFYNHCISTDSEWVVYLEADVRTIRRIRNFPQTDAAGARLNPFSPALTKYLVDTFGDKEYGYGMCGGCIWKREAFIQAYETNHDLAQCVVYDERVARFGDIALTLLFLVNGYEYSVWDEISEIFHDVAPIIRDSAFDHAYKYWYDKDFDKSLLGLAE
jgi:hypothetical protein